MSSFLSNNASWWQRSAVDPALELGTTTSGKACGIMLNKLLAGRLFIQGASGSGKSWLLRRLIEQANNQIQQVVIDPEGELSTLMRCLNRPVAQADKLPANHFGSIGYNTRYSRQSMALNVAQAQRPQQLACISNLLRALVEAPREIWTPALIYMDEAQVFCPQRPDIPEQKATTASVIDLMDRGRKRGLGSVVATLRIADVAKSVVSEALNYMIGKTTLDIDVRRAGGVLGWNHAKASQILPNLSTGQFVTMGPAFWPQEHMIIEIGNLAYPNIGGTPKVDQLPTQLGSAAGARALGF